MFVDSVRIEVRGGRGGDGVTAFSRQPYEPYGPPTGGDGGHGGSVVVVADSDVATLIDYHHRPHRAADRGRHGEGDRRRGADGADVELPVPVGTVVTTDDGDVLADLARAGDRVVVADGGRGGRGNAALRTRRRRSPKFHERGEPGVQHWVRLELKLVADVALVGFPNVGKSSLIARLSAARPKIADYPFTTLTPNLGVVAGDDLDLVIADVPGLIAGASEGRGLGHQFLRHVERARVLVHVLDCASYEQRDPREDLRTVLSELDAYDAREGDRLGFAQRPALVVLNKVDADRETALIVRDDLVADGFEVLETSAVTGEGIDALRWRLIDLVRASRRVDPLAPATDAPAPVLRPLQEAPTVDVVRVGGGWRVTGTHVERWVRMTDLDNAEAVRYLQDRMERAGVDRTLSEAGAQPGDDVEIAGHVFTFEPADDATAVTTTEDGD
ncbi:MAG: GTPase ObgE [Actinobacteria bacterium]|nr:GTPase ObgE [Actinomycetota bacterium]